MNFDVSSGSILLIFNERYPYILNYVAKKY